MATTPTLDRPTTTEPEKKRNWLFPVVIMLVVAVGAIALWWLLAGGGEETRIEKVENAIAAVNDGTYEDKSAHYATGFTANLPTTANVTNEEMFAYEQAIGTRATIVKPCEEIAGNVACTVRYENDLFIVAGIAPELVETFFFNQSDQIIGMNTSEFAEYIAFYSAYPDWLSDAHPEVYDRVMAAPARGAIQFSADTANLWAAHIEEFVAQSDVYPINP